MNTTVAGHITVWEKHSLSSHAQALDKLELSLTRGSSVCFHATMGKP